MAKFQGRVSRGIRLSRSLIPETAAAELPTLVAEEDSVENLEAEEQKAGFDVTEGETSNDLRNSNEGSQTKIQSFRRRRRPQQSDISDTRQDKLSDARAAIGSDLPKSLPNRRHDKVLTGYAHCPPPPHAGKGWINSCLTDGYRTALDSGVSTYLEIEQTLLPEIGNSAYILLGLGIALGLAGILMWSCCLVHSVRYLRKSHVYPRGSRELQGNALRRKFKKNRPRVGISERWFDTNGSEGQVWPEEVEEKIPILANNICDLTNEKLPVYEESPPDRFNQIESKYGKPAGRVFLDGLVGSMKGGAWMRRALAPGPCEAKSLREMAMAQCASMGKDGEGRTARDSHPMGSSLARNGRDCEQFASSGSIRSVSGVDMMNGESGANTLSLRRDAVLRRAIKPHDNSGVDLRRNTYSVNDSIVAAGGVNGLSEKVRG